MPFISSGLPQPAHCWETRYNTASASLWHPATRR
ncbi:hypothetical protein SCAR479_12305 [Seiridium cardinale]|uniref:Uncharacterized protein n=1 Tax=Seiridium cardinale TaxID=138064 RepID=A0ABR2XBD7_9PEZI